MIILILSLKDDELSKKITPLLNSLIDNKELISMLLKNNHSTAETREEKKDEHETPPRENGAANEAVNNFLNTYFK